MAVTLLIVVGFNPSLVYVKVQGGVPVKPIAISVVSPEQIVAFPLVIVDVGKILSTVILALPVKLVPVQLESERAITS